MLDRNRKYGIVYGDPVKCYYQDGTFYDGQGRPVDKAVKEAVEDHEPVQVAETDDSKSDRLTTLQGMHVSALKKLAKKVADQLDVDLPKYSGKGVKAKLVTWIADHTTD